MGCFSGHLMSAASDQKLFCKLCSPFCCSSDEFVEEKVISGSYSSAIFIFKFFNVVYHIDWFVDVKESLHSWDKARLVMVYDFLNMLLDSVC